MDLELVTVGTELLLGFTVDSNAADIARALAPVGARVVRRTTVGDDAAAIEDAIRAALARTGTVIVTGGLGPTRDDVTKRAAAAVFGAPLELDGAYLETLRRRFDELGRGPMPPANRSQAEVPRGAAILPNRWGTAPGLWLEDARGLALLLPGVPREMRQLLAHEVIPRIRGRAGEAGSVIQSLALRTTGVAESALAGRIGDLEDALAPVTLAYLPSATGVDLRLTAWDVTAAEAMRLLEAAAARLAGVLGRDCYGRDGDDLAAVVLDRLRAAGQRLAVAESCTGGLLGQRITAIPGSSATFVGGVIAYADAVKTAQLGVTPGLLAEHGAVSEPVVRAMVDGARRTFGVEAALAITGIAGPDGGTPEKPVGTVWLAAAAGARTETTGLRMPGGRDEVRARSAQGALNLLRLLL
jgi:nicotinamide-nucleotide amidase